MKTTGQTSKNNLIFYAFVFRFLASLFVVLNLTLYILLYFGQMIFGVASVDLHGNNIFLAVSGTVLMLIMYVIQAIATYLNRSELDPMKNKQYSLPGWLFYVFLVTQCLALLFIHYEYFDVALLMSFVAVCSFLATLSPHNVEHSTVSTKSVLPKEG